MGFEMPTSQFESYNYENHNVKLERKNELYYVNKSIVFRRIQNSTKSWLEINYVSGEFIILLYEVLKNVVGRLSIL